VPTRDAPVFAATATATVPFAFPLWPEVIVSHGAALVADHEQPASVDTFTDKRPPLAPMPSRVLLRVNAHGAAAWLIVIRSDPTVSDPLRGDGTGFAATEYGTTASPCPLLAPAIETHVASDVIAQVQSRVVEMLSDPLPPLAANDAGVLPSVVEHLPALGPATEVEVELQAAARKASPSASAAVARDRAPCVRVTVATRCTRLASRASTH
jgi:hypothetical protein